VNKRRGRTGPEVPSGFQGRSPPPPACSPRGLAPSARIGARNGLLFRGTCAQARLDADLRRAPRKLPIYTDKGRVADGIWKIVGHDDSLLALFPSDPPIYHRPNAWPGIADTGEFGAAETADRPLRLIGPDEAREVGLQVGTYRPVRHAAWLQKLLDDQAG
jgi:hypothetical protein